MDDFVLMALIGGLGIAAVMGPLGVFVVWRRMAYFGDTLAHSALLGIALGFLLGVNLTVGVAVVCVTMAVLLVLLRQRQPLAEDTLLGILSHSALALGLIAVSFQDSLRVDLVTYLFGDILSISTTDIVWIFAVGGLVIVAVVLLWRPLIAITVDEDLARVEGIPVLRTQLLFMLLIAGVIALAMKIVGILLVTSLLIIPAATARRFARTPEQMAVLAAVAGCLGVILGLQGSVLWDVPSGPAIVAAATALFAAATAIPRRSSSGSARRPPAAHGAKNSGT